ncbi:MAG: DUF5662 family protein [Nitrososphaerota archaeon]|jgi:hypothetical protein|nr:DUF5662 family protein [Nitrososphaerota archaeon]
MKMDPQFTLKKAHKHFQVITKHRIEVGKVCFRAGLYWQGITHDLSKYLPTEFISSARYYPGTSSPIDAEKKNKGYSLAWLHHRGRNPHHWEYWIEGLNNGGVPLKMPLKYLVELACDFIGAGKVYLDKSWTFSEPFKYSQDELLKGNIKLHSETQELLLQIFKEFEQKGFSALKQKNIATLAESLNYV